jgi:DNA-binding MarR family transcriptional regulator
MSRRRTGAGAAGAPEPTAHDYRRAADFRAALRGYLRLSERVARANGLTPQRHLLLLMVRGAPDGSESATVGELAERLQLAQNSVTDLAARAVGAGLLSREPSADDGRVVRLRLTREGERRLAAVVAELAAERERLADVLGDGGPG